MDAQSVDVMPLLPHGQFYMPCFELVVVPLKESCGFPHLKLYATIVFQTEKSMTVLW